VKSIRFPTTPSRPNLLHRAELVGKFDLASLRVVGLRQAVIGGYFSDGRFQNLHQVLNCLIP
jgi:cytochrome c peroxidase